MEDRDKIERQSVELIKKKKLVFIEHLIAFLPISKSTFYTWGLHESDAIKSALTEAKVNVKTKLMTDWLKSTNPTLQIALYKLVSDDDEFNRLTSQKLEHSGEISHQIIFQEIEAKPQEEIDESSN